MIDLSGKTALVTGGGRGIGRAIAIALAEAGSNVIITYYQNPGPATMLVDKMSYLKTYFWEEYLDVTDPASIQNALRSIFIEGGSLDILVNNAGVNYPANFDDIEMDLWRNVIDTNLTGPYLVTKQAIPYMSYQGSIIFISSVSGFIGGPRTTHYAVSKLGLVALCQNVVRTFSPQVRANVVAPGYIVSPMADGGMQDPKVKEQVNSIPMERLGTAEDVAGAVLYLASDLSKYVTGQILHVNGGLYMGI